MGENQQQGGPERQGSATPPVLQRGHSGRGAKSALDLLRRRRDVESQRAPRPEPPDGPADRRGPE